MNPVSLAIIQATLNMFFLSIKTSIVKVTIKLIMKDFIATQTMIINIYYNDF